MPSEYHRVLFPAFGDVSQVTVVSGHLDDPPAKHVQVQVLYAGFGGTDVNMRKGKYPFQRKAPLTPGYSLVGRVVQRGANTTKFQPGDLVACLSIYDAHAELANLPEKYCVSLPDGLRDRLPEATALVVDWTTAYGAVYRAAKVQKGQRIFVHGMSGAVGYALTQLSLRLGATVYGTASEKNHALLQELGARPFTYKTKDWIREMKSLGGAHAVFDPLGFESWDESWDILCPKEKSILVGYGGNLASLTGEERGSVWPPTTKLIARGMVPGCPKSTSFYYISRDSSSFEPELRECMKLLAENQLDLRIKKCYAGLQEVKTAHGDWEGGQLTGIGSLVVQIGS